MGHTRAQGYTGHSVPRATQGPRATLDTLFNGPHKGPGLHWTLSSRPHKGPGLHWTLCSMGHTRAQGYTGHSVQWATQGPRATLDTLFNWPHKGPGLHWTLSSRPHKGPGLHWTLSSRPHKGPGLYWTLCSMGHTRAQGYTGHSVQWATQGPRATLDTPFHRPHKGPGLHWTLCSMGHTRAQGYTGHCPVGHTRAQGYTGHSVQWATQGPRATLDTLFNGPHKGPGLHWTLCSIGHTRAQGYTGHCPVSLVPSPLPAAILQWSERWSGTFARYFDTALWALAKILASASMCCDTQFSSFIRSPT